MWQGQGAHLENEALLAAVRERELDFTVQPPRPQQRRVQCVCAIGGHDHLRVPTLCQGLLFKSTG